MDLRHRRTATYLQSKWENTTPEYPSLYRVRRRNSPERPILSWSTVKPATARVIQVFHNIPPGTVNLLGNCFYRRIKFPEKSNCRRQHSKAVHPHSGLLPAMLPNSFKSIPNVKMIIFYNQVWNSVAPIALVPLTVLSPGKRLHPTSNPTPFNGLDPPNRSGVTTVEEMVSCCWPFRESQDSGSIPTEPLSSESSISPENLMHYLRVMQRSLDNFEGQYAPCVSAVLTFLTYNVANHFRPIRLMSFKGVLPDKRILSSHLYNVSCDCGL